MDKLAKTGTRITQAYAHNVCCPSRALILTGRYPQRGGVTAWTQANAKGKKGRNMSSEEITLAEVLKGGGGNTGKWRGHKNTFFEAGYSCPSDHQRPESVTPRSSASPRHHRNGLDAHSS
jgi:arylsulfatase A-like enzyme